MIIHYPGYYKKFHCLAGECPDTCCIGWEITVDRETEKTYQKLRKGKSELAERLRRSVRRRLIIPDGDRCPFLAGDGLCDLCREYGEAAMTRTCRRYPRHVEDFGDIHEVELLCSCPEAARLILSEDFRLITRNMPERKGNTDGIDEERLALWFSVREQVFAMAGDRRMPLWARMRRILAFCHDVQGRLRREDTAGVEALVGRAKETACRRNGADPVPDLIDGDKTGDHLQTKEERMTERNVPGRLKEADHREKDWEKTNDVYTPGKADMHNLEERFSLMADFFAEFASLSPIGHGFPELLECSRTFLYHSEDSRSRYEERQQEFRRNMPETEVCTERLLFYFLYSFVMPGFYDGNLYTKAKMAVFGAVAAEELEMAEYFRNPGKYGKRTGEGRGKDAEPVTSLENDEMVTERSAKERISALSRTAYLFVRQIENSAENRDLLEQLVKQPEFGIRRLVGAD
nr:flagellin lysine-N-methylase [Clostridium sp. CM74B_53]